MNDLLHSTGLAWRLAALMACLVLVAGCQDGSGPSLVTSPEGKPAYEGAKPPPPLPPPADPAIAYVVSTRTGNDLRVANADGTNHSTIHSRTDLIMWPSWSPDGASIAFNTVAPGDIWLVDIVLANGVPTGTNTRVLLAESPGNSLAYPAWSPLGGEVAFARHSDDGSGPATLEVIPAIGGTPEVLYTTPPGQPGVGVLHPTWNSDASEIAFVSGGIIWAVDVSTKAARILYTPSQYPSSLDWGRIRNALTFHMPTGNQNGVYTLEIGAGILAQVASGLQPTWSPDDSEILFINQSGKLCKVRLATGSITNLGISGNQPDWRRF